MNIGQPGWLKPKMEGVGEVIQADEKISPVEDTTEPKANAQADTTRSTEEK